MGRSSRCSSPNARMPLTVPLTRDYITEFERAKCESHDRRLTESGERRESTTVIHTSYKLTYHNRGSRAL
jgi:hypothetical protein